MGLLGRQSIFHARTGTALVVLALMLGPVYGAHAQTATADGGTDVTSPTTVDIQALPASVNAAAPASNPLPFMHPGGDAALQRARAAAPAQPAPGIVQNTGFGAATPPTIIKGGPAVRYSDTTCGCYPPDGAIAVGKSYVIAAANTAFKIYRTSGSLVFGPQEFSSFFSGAGCKSSYSDPTVDYDVASDRYIIEILSFSATTGSSNICIALSQTNNPTGSWTRYAIPVQGGSNYLLDFPHLAIGTSAIYLSGNLFTCALLCLSSTFLGARVYALNKSQMYAGTAVTSVYRTLSSSYDTVWPARSTGSNIDPGYFLAVDNTLCPATCSNLYLWKWTDPFGTNQFTFRGSVGIGNFGEPIVAPQNGGTVTTNDSRNLQAYLFNGTVYGAHAISCPQSTGTGTIDCVQWYQLGNVDGPGAPVLIQSGTLGADGQYRFFPSLAVDKVGDMSIAYSYSSGTDYIGIRYTGRLATDALGTVQAEGVVKAGEAYNAKASSRWGDYASEVVAPDGCTIVHLEEYAPSGTVWSTWMGAWKFANCQ